MSARDNEPRSDERSSDQTAMTARSLGIDAEKTAQAVQKHVDDLQDRIQEELTRHPLRTLAAAAAVGFLLSQRFR
jgi:hypothetical protein